VSEQTPFATDEFDVPDSLPSFAGATGWINTQPLSATDLRGKVVLVEFWTYSCINWLRTEPYVRAWAEKYRDKGLVVIGVHSPEFGFEKDVDNVRWAAKNLNVGNPIAIDSDHAVWRAFNNRYWPAIYVADADGRIRYHQFGEGNYEKTEAVIQQLLTEAGAAGVAHDLVAVEGRGIEAAPDWGDLRSGETYLGYQRTENFTSSDRAVLEKAHYYNSPTRLRLNQWSVSGDWTIGSESITLNQANGRMAYRFHARDLNLVMGPASSGASIRFRILIDGLPPGGAHGIDVDEQGYGIISEPRLYQLIRQTRPIVDRQFEIEFLDPGVEAFSVTFG
jgi:thiol-disulfide isomerase/thioredoxin